MLSGERVKILVEILILTDGQNELLSRSSDVPEVGVRFTDLEDEPLEFIVKWILGVALLLVLIPLRLNKPLSLSLDIAPADVITWLWHSSVSLWDLLLTERLFLLWKAGTEEKGNGLGGAWKLDDILSVSPGVLHRILDGCSISGVLDGPLTDAPAEGKSLATDSTPDNFLKDKLESWLEISSLCNKTLFVLCKYNITINTRNWQ